jgi:hypothetical protein
MWAMEANERIAFVDLQGQLATIAPNGGDHRQLTAGEQRFQFPAWSPDNQTLAAIGGTQGEGGVFAVSASPAVWPTPAQPIYQSREHPPVYCSWSPDGATIGLLAAHPTQRLALHLVDPAADPAHTTPTLLIGGQPCFWHWHADSHGLFAHVDLGRTSAQVAHVRWRLPGTATIQPLAIQPGNFQAPAISHDSRYVAYAQLTPAGSSQLVVAGRDRKTVIGEHEGFVALNWSPRSAQLAFLHPLATHQQFYGPLHLWDAESGQVRRLSPETALAFFWSPDGRQIAYLAVAETDPVTPRLPGGATNGHFKGTWPLQHQAASEALQLALSVIDVATGQRRALTTFTPTAPLINQFLPFFDQYSKSHSLWSAHSDALVLATLEDDRPMLTIVDATTGHSQPLAPGTMGVWRW